MTHLHGPQWGRSIKTLTIHNLKSASGAMTADGFYKLSSQNVYTKLVLDSTHQHLSKTNL